MTISVVIPAYGYGGHAIQYLNRLLESISRQTYLPCEIVVADHSLGPVVEEYCRSVDLPILYLRNPTKRGNSSANMNFGIQHASGDIIKIMHMDDFFSSPDALESVAGCLDDPTFSGWGALGFSHFESLNGESTRPIVPSLTSTLGCPSVSFFIRNLTSPDYFDENLTIINDHDMHQSLLIKYGRPRIIDTLHIGIGVTDFQFSKIVNNDRYELERQYFVRKRSLGVMNIQREQATNDTDMTTFVYVSESRVSNHGTSWKHPAAGFRLGLRRFVKGFRKTMAATRTRTSKRPRAGDSFEKVEYIEKA